MIFSSAGSEVSAGSVCWTRVKAAFLGVARLGGDIDLAGRILADDDHGKTGLGLALATSSAVSVLTVRTTSSATLFPSMISAMTILNSLPSACCSGASAARHFHENSNTQSRQSAVPCRKLETGMFLFGTARYFMAQK